MQEIQGELSPSSLETTHLILRALNSSSAACVTLGAMTAMVAPKGIYHFPIHGYGKGVTNTVIKKMWPPIAVKEN